MIRRPDKSWKSLAPRLFPSSEKDAAHRGYPSSSKPAGAPVSEPAPKSAAALALPKVSFEPGELQRGLLQLQGPSLQKLRVLDQISVFKLWWTSSRLASRCQQRGSSRTPPDEVEFTSASHRASYARLARRMEKLDVSSFPQMHRLWAGSRKDQCYVGFVIFKKISIHLNNCSTIPTHGICGCASMRTSRSS